MTFMEDCEYECEYIERIEIMKNIAKVRKKIFEILKNETDTLTINEEEEIVCLKEVLDFLRDWECKYIEDPIDLGETMDGLLSPVDDKQRKGVKELNKAILEHIRKNYVNKEIFDFDIETTFKEYYNVY